MNLLDSLSNRYLVVLYTVDKYFIIIVLMLMGLILHLYRKNFERSIQNYLLYLIIFLVSVLQWVQKPTFTDYQIILVPLSAILASIGYTEIYHIAKDNLIKFGLAFMIIFMILLTPLSQSTVVVDLSGDRRPIQEIDEMAQYINEHTPEKGKLLAFSTYVAVQSKKDLLPGLEMSIASFFPNWSTDKAERYKVINTLMLEQYIRSKSASAILLTDFEIQVLRISSDTLRLVEQNYYLAKTMPQWGQWKDTAYLYLPRKDSDKISEDR